MPEIISQCGSTAYESSAKLASVSPNIGGGASANGAAFAGGAKYAAFIPSTTTGVPTAPACLAAAADNHFGLYNHIRGFAVTHGDPTQLSPKLRAYLDEVVLLCQPQQIHICDGSERENNALLRLMQAAGTIEPLPKYENCWLARTNPADVARVESRTFICTERREETIPAAAAGVTGRLGNWISAIDMQAAIAERFPGCMRGRTMYVMAFSMGPLGSALAKLGVEVTDSPYVVASMRIMTRMGASVMRTLCAENANFVRCLHSVGRPADAAEPTMAAWPCDPKRVIILHKPATNDIVSYGSGYGGNSLLGKKCLALRIGSTIARREGWLAEHMLIVGITNAAGVKRYVAAAFPSACGKTNLAMMQPALKGYKVECVGDDIAWMRLDAAGQLRAINPENGFFGVAPGTAEDTNPVAMRTVFKNTIFTNVAATSDGGVWWEGMPLPSADIQITDWLGKPWTAGGGTPAAHPNSRFCTPATQCPMIDAAWQDPEGVPISAILFGGRRPQGVPLVFEARSWAHGVFVGAAMRSETTAAAEHVGKAIMHDPMAMRPFFGYNFGAYLAHWLGMEERAQGLGGRMPPIFHVNWFRKAEQSGRFLWPGFGENARVLDWVLRRVEGAADADYVETAVGRVPAVGALHLEGLPAAVRGAAEMEELFAVPREFWLRECDEVERYFGEQVGADLPAQIGEELRALRERVERA